MKRILGFVLAAFVLGQVAYAAAKPASVLVVSEKSKYKAALLEKVTGMLEDRRCKVTSVKIEELGEQDVENYAVVIVLTSVPGWRKGAFPAFIKKSNAELRKKLLVVTTANRPNWKTPKVGVHAVTSASKKDTIEPTLEKIEKGLDEILGE
jgi:hypothetical protein